MGIYIDSETKRVTTECKKSFSCLHGSLNELCGIEEFMDGNVRHIKCVNRNKCSYQVPYGSNRLCSCPTRKEIHSLYGY